MTARTIAFESLVLALLKVHGTRIGAVMDMARAEAKGLAFPSALDEALAELDKIEARVAAEIPALIEKQNATVRSA